MEPYLQRHPYTFEVQKRVMPGWAQVARRHGQGLLNHNSKLLRTFYVSRGLLPQNSNLTLGAFAPNFGVRYFEHPFFNFGPGVIAPGWAQVDPLLLPSHLLIISYKQHSNIYHFPFSQYYIKCIQKYTNSHFNSIL